MGAFQPNARSGHQRKDAIVSGIARSGRFARALHESAATFLSSLRFDWRLLQDDVKGSLAHVAMLKKSRIIPAGAAERISQGLQTILHEWEAGVLAPRPDWEDVHMNVEGRLQELIGEEAGYLHTARSRNDQVALDMHLYMLRQGGAIAAQCRELMMSLAALAQRTQEVIMPGYTHLQPAQPVRMAHHWLAYGSMFQRDYTRLMDWFERANVSPLGAGALAGTPYPTDPEYTRELLGLAHLYHNSLDAVSDRDYLLEFLGWASIFVVHVSRLAEELVLWSSREFQFIALGDAFSTGSSIMPQKKNPDVAELLRGKSGRIFGHLISLLTVMKGLPLAYNSDMQEDKEAIFDTVDTVQAILDILPPLLSDLTINPPRLQEAAVAQFSNATDLADRIAQEGVPFRQAHHRVGELVRLCVESGYQSFAEVPAEVWAQWAPAIPAAWIDELAPQQLADARQQSFATGKDSVARQLEEFTAWLNQLPEAGTV